MQPDLQAPKEWCWTSALQSCGFFTVLYSLLWGGRLHCFTRQIQFGEKLISRAAAPQYLQTLLHAARGRLPPAEGSCEWRPAVAWCGVWHRYCRRMVLVHWPGEPWRRYRRFRNTMNKVCIKYLHWCKSDRASRSVWPVIYHTTTIQLPETFFHLKDRSCKFQCKFQSRPSSTAACMREVPPLELQVFRLLQAELQSCQLFWGKFTVWDYILYRIQNTAVFLSRSVDFICTIQLVMWLRWNQNFTSLGVKTLVQ